MTDKEKLKYASIKLEQIKASLSAKPDAEEFSWLKKLIEDLLKKINK